MKLKTTKVNNILLILSSALLLYFFPFIFLVIIICTILILEDRKLQNSQFRMTNETSFKILRNNLYDSMGHFWQLNNKNIDSLLFNKANDRIEGSIIIPDLELEHKFHYSTDEKGRRICSKNNSLTEKPIIAVYGCSFTWGTGIKDEDTFCWKLQEKFPEYKILNYGKPGFSLYEIVLMLEQNISTDKPAITILAYHECQDPRSTGKYPDAAWYLGPRCLSIKLPWKKQRKLYTFWNNTPARILSLIDIPILRVLGHIILSCPFLPMNNKRVITETSKHLLLKAQKKSEEQGSKFLIFAIQPSEESKTSFFNDNSISWSLFSPASTNFKKEYTLFPFDGHYNSKANSEIADIVAEAVKKMLTGNISIGKMPEEKLSKEKLDFVYPMF